MKTYIQLMNMQLTNTFWNTHYVRKSGFACIKICFNLSCVLEKSESSVPSYTINVMYKFMYMIFYQQIIYISGGYNYYGTEKMYSGIDGCEMKANIFFGIVHYQRLRHMVSDKWQVRSSACNRSLPPGIITQIFNHINTCYLTPVLY
jgi:hypothetical protein